MKYSVRSNMTYVYKASIKHNPKIVLYLIVNFIPQVTVIALAEVAIRL